MATFNGASHVGEQLDSIAVQSLLPVEVVVSDDGSVDSTRSEIEKRRRRFEELGIALRVVANDGERGVAGNFQNAVFHCSGVLVALSDQDDVWLPEKLEKLEAAFSRDADLMLAHSDADLVGDDLRPLGMGMLESLRTTKWEREQLLSTEIFRALIRRNLVTGATVMLRRELVLHGPPVPAGWLHDYWWALLASSKHAAIYIDSRLTLYRQHSSNQVGARKMGVTDLFERFRQPRDDFLESQEARNSGLKKLVEAGWPITAEARQLIIGRLEHFEWLQGLSNYRIMRFGPVLRRLLKGDYSKYRRGVFDAMRDLFQPAG